MDGLVEEDLIVVRRHGLWVEVEIRTDILFPSGVATLSPAAEDVLRQLAADAQAVPEPDARRRPHGQPADQHARVPVELGTVRRPAPRASCICSRMPASIPARLSVIGFGEHRPAQSNDTPEGRNANRRVLLVIMSGNGMPEGSYGQERGLPEPAPTVPSDVTITEASTPPAAVPVDILPATIDASAAPLAVAPTAIQ